MMLAQVLNYVLVLSMDYFLYSYGSYCEWQSKVEHLTLSYYSLHPLILSSYTNQTLFQDTRLQVQ